MRQVAKNIDDQIAAVQTDNRGAHRQLRQLIESGKADDASVNQLADRILADRAKVRQLEDARLVELRKVLRPVDYGRLLLVWPQVNQQIKAEIFRALAPGQQTEE
jgi:hypothetical protein